MSKFNQAMYFTSLLFLVILYLIVIFVIIKLLTGSDLLLELILSLGFISLIQLFLLYSEHSIKANLKGLRVKFLNLIFLILLSNS